MNSVFVGLQTIATLALAVGAEQLAVKNYLVGLLACVVGIVAYAVYELVPPKPPTV